jgi:hypothetical protein
MAARWATLLATAASWSASATCSLAVGLPLGHIGQMPKLPEKRYLEAAALFLAAVTLFVILAWLRAHVPWWGRP